MKSLYSAYQHQVLKFNSKSSRSFSESLTQDMNFSFNINDFSSEWVNVYKEDYVNSLRDNFKVISNENPLIDFDDFVVLKYIYKWILVDFFEILPFIPSSVSSILNIGAGVGYLDIILSQLYQSNKYYLIEKDTSDNELHFDCSSHVMREKIYPLTLLKNNLDANGIKNSSFMSPSDFKKNIDDFSNPASLVLSFRSYCYLYDIDEYYDSLKIISDPNTSFILDVNVDRLEEFKEKFILVNMIKGYETFYRVLARLK